MPHHLEFDATYRFVARLPSQHLPAYDELDLRLAWQPTPPLELSISGQNLLHAQHAEFGLPASRQLIERSVYGEIQWRY